MGRTHTRLGCAGESSHSQREGRERLPADDGPLPLKMLSLLSFAAEYPSIILLVRDLLL